jgi:nucleoid DNA-binding protein
MKIRLTEGQLHKVIKESVRRIIREENEIYLDNMERKFLKREEDLRKLKAPIKYFKELAKVVNNFAKTLKPSDDTTDNTQYKQFNRFEDIAEEIEDRIYKIETGENMTIPREYKPRFKPNKIEDGYDD